MYRAISCALVISIILLASGGSSAESDSANPGAGIRAAMNSRNFAKAEQLVRELKADSTSAYASSNYDYLLGRLLERRGALQEAKAAYDQVAARRSVLAGYALWRLARIARTQGDATQERVYLRRLLSSGPFGPLAETANQRLTESLFESGDFRSVISRLQSAGGARRERERLVLLGNAYIGIGNTSAARAVFSRLNSAGLHDDYALAACIGLDQLDREAGASPDQFETIRRARIYLENRRWTEARRHFERIINVFPNSPNRPEALYQAGYACFRQDDFAQAIKWFDRAHAEFPSKKEGEHGYYWVATALQKAGRFLEAASRYEDFLKVYPRSDYQTRAYLNIIDCYRYSGRKSEAIEWAKRAEQVFAGQPMAAVGLFDEAKIQLSIGNYEAALSLLTRLQGAPLNLRQLGSPGPGEVAFLRAVALELAGRVQEAVSLYLAIPDERDNYFGHRATLRIAGLAATERGQRIIGPIAKAYKEQSRKALSAGNFREAKDASNQALRLVRDDADRRELLDILRTCYRNLSGYSSVFNYRASGFAEAFGGDTGTGRRSGAAAALLSLGLYDDAADQIFGEGSRKSKAGRPAAALGLSPFSLAVLANRGNHADYAIAYAEPLLGSIPPDFQIELMPRDLAELLYPAPYRDELLKYCGKLQVDPRLVLSLARQESRFNPGVKSSASARGLLQLIPETAEAMANEAGLKGFGLEDAYEPEVAIHLGTLYVSHLKREFGGNAYAVAAGYNTDDDNVKRWILRAQSSDPDRFVAEIALPETKDYVAKVMNNYSAYKKLYTRELRPRD